MPTSKPHVLLMGQTPPPWHGQAVATQILFDHDWPEFCVHRLRMEFSEEMDEVGRFQLRKLKHLFSLILKARRILKAHPGCILFYPPASAKWVPFLRDVVFLNAVRHLAARTVFIFHASGLPVFAERNWLTRLLSWRAYHGADMSLEVARENIPAHRVFRAWDDAWCPCAITVGEVPRKRPDSGPIIALFVASLQEGKGVLEILRTAKNLKDKGRSEDFRFRIVGKWFSKEFEREARGMHQNLDLGEMVEFVGQLTGDEKWQAYADADVFFFPTHYESEATPIVIMEALGMGLRVLSTQWAGIPAMLEGCETATLLPVRSPEAYADALELMAGAPDARFALREKAIEFYRDRFLPERFVQRVADAFTQVARIDALNEKKREETDWSRRKIRGQESEVSGQRSKVRDHKPSQSDLSPLSPPITSNQSPITLSIYLADQNPMLGRSLGISRMTEVVTDELRKRGDMRVHGLASRSSIDTGIDSMCRVLPWETKTAFTRVLTDHFHPLFQLDGQQDVWYYPKGFLPILNNICSPSVVTIHDTIVQHYSDRYPEWRNLFEYRYWEHMLKHTLTNADHILTVSHTSKRHITEFMARNGIEDKEIVVTYEPCLYEAIPQPENPAKGDYVLHLGSREPHKQTAWLIDLWLNENHKHWPLLHVVGTVPNGMEDAVSQSERIVKLPFLDDEALRDQFTAARALVFPSEIEGFGLPAIEAYYLGTPVCFVNGTSVEEVLEVATDKGGFHLDEPESLNQALDEVLIMSAETIRDVGLKLRETYAASKVVDRMAEVFAKAAGRNR